MRTHTHHISTPPAVPTLRGKRRDLFSDTRHTNRHHGQYSQRLDVKQQLQRTTGESWEWVCCPRCPCLQEGSSVSRRQPRESGCVSRWTGHADGKRAFFAAATADCRCCFRGTTPRITLRKAIPPKAPLVLRGSSGTIVRVLGVGVRRGSARPQSKCLTSALPLLCPALP